MSAQESNKTLYRRYVDTVVNQGKTDQAREYVGDDYTVHASGETVRRGPRGVAEIVRTWREGFPDLNVNVVLLIAENDLLASHVTLWGTHRGPFFGIPASGNRIAINGVGIERVRDGKLIESWREIDLLQLHQQIAVIPSGAQGTVIPDRPEAEITRFYQTSSSTVQQNKQAMLNYVAAVNAAGPDEISHGDEYLDVPNYVWHSAAWGGQTHDEAMATYGMVKRAIPDLKFVPNASIQVGESEYVATFGGQTGTHSGTDMFGIPPSGRALTWDGIDISRFHDGKIVERWVAADILRLMRQIGFPPGPTIQPPI